VDIERTFWEKATLIHVASVKEQRYWEVHARHWYDLIRIVESKHGERCMADQDSAQSVVEFESWFYSEKSVDYKDAITGKIRIVPTGDIQSALKSDYVGLAGMFERDPYVFDILIDKCKQMDKTSEEWS
jgi:hypothetical protein